MGSLEFATEAGISGKYDRLIDAKMRILHGDADAIGEARLIPIMQFTLRVPFETGNLMAKWALAPIGKGRFAKVKLTLTERSVDETHTWELQKAYVHRLEEIEFPADAQNATSQENVMLVVIRGVVANGEDYSGENVLTMTSASINAPAPLSPAPTDSAPSTPPSATAASKVIPLPVPTISPLPTLPPGVITEEQAKDTFNDLAAKKEDIPFDYPVDCCFARAHEMSRIMEDRGIPSRKVWNYASSGNVLSVDTPKNAIVPSGRVEWGYHVAPTVKVQNDKGEINDMVMDPSIFDHPVTEKQWHDIQRDTAATLEHSGPEIFYRDKGASPRRVIIDPDYSLTKQYLEDHKLTRNNLLGK